MKGQSVSQSADPTFPLRDPEIRKAVHNLLADEHRNDDDTLVLDELGISSHSVRVDIAVLNGSFAGFEIKSDVDSLSRLAGQVTAYDEVFDYMTLVTGTRHSSSARAHVPKHWGIIQAKARADGVELTVRRRPKLNKRYDKRSLSMMLWRDELVVALKARGAYSGLSRLPKGALWDRLSEVAEVDELRTLVRQAIKARGDWRSDLRSW